MYFRRINDTTINCIISTDDLSENHIRLDDLFERKREAMDYLRRVIAAAAREENFNLRTDYTSMRITVLPDHSLSLTLTAGDNGARAVKDIRDINKKAGKGTGKDKAKKGGRSLPKDLVKAAKKSAAVKPAGKKKEAIIFDIVLNIEVLHEIIELKDKTDLVKSHCRESLLLHLADIISANTYRAVEVSVKTAYEIEQCGFSASRCAHE